MDTLRINLLTDDPIHKYQIIGIENQIEYELARFRTEYGVEAGYDIFCKQIKIGFTIKELAEIWKFYNEVLNKRKSEEWKIQMN